MAVFFQVMILIVVLAAMVMILLGIRQLTDSEGFEDNLDTEELKRNLVNGRDVISERNIFGNLVDKKDEEVAPLVEEVYNSTRHDPSSRKL